MEVHNNVRDKLRRFKLAFVCLMTAVGSPMIFAGDEFADQQDLLLEDLGDRNKQIDPIDFTSSVSGEHYSQIQHRRECCLHTISSNKIALGNLGINCKLSVD